MRPRNAVVLAMVPTFIIAIYWAIVVTCTAAFYAWIVLFGFAAIKNARRPERSVRTFVYGCAACLPIVWYCAEYMAAVVKHRRLDAQVVDAQSLPKLAHAPHILVDDGGGRGRWPLN